MVKFTINGRVIYVDPTKIETVEETSDGGVVISTGNNSFKMAENIYVVLNSLGIK